MRPVEPERVTDGADLVDERLDVPQRLVRAARFPAADLVVEDRPPARLGHPLEGFEVVVRRSGPSVEQQERELALVLALADDPVPGLEPAERDVAVGALHLSASRTG